MSGFWERLTGRKMAESTPLNRGPETNIQEERGNWWGSEVVIGGESGGGGVNVTPETALTSSAVFACVRILAETMAAFPLITYKRMARGRERATEYYLYDILHDNPNDWMTSFEYRETIQGHLATWGNGYSQIDYDEAGRVKSLFPLRPDKMLEMDIEGGRKRYKYQLPSGESRWIPGEMVWHLKAFGDGMFGYSPIQLMKQSVGLAIATEKYGSKFYLNGARPGGVLEHPGKLSKDAHGRLRESWNESHQGLENAHKVAILEEGLKWHDTGLPPGTIQFIETRKYQVTDIARIYRIPPHMIADLEHATFSNIEHLSLEFVQNTILPWARRWEQSISKNLMLEGERKLYYAEFLLDGLLRGDIQSRTQYYVQGKQWGWLSSNDIREKENMNPIEGGDAYWQPMNMVEQGEAESTHGEETGDGRPGTEEESEPRNTRNTRNKSAGQPQMNTDEHRWEVRARGVAGERYKLSKRQIRVFADVAGRILRREKNDVQAAAKKFLTPGTGPVMAFEQWLFKFYEDHAVWSAEQMEPAMMAYGGMVADYAGRELDKEGDLVELVEEFIRAYAVGFGTREGGRSLSRLLEIVRQDGLSQDEMRFAVDVQLEQWAEGERAESIGHEEAVRENNAVSVALYETVGVEAIVSVATGESDCPYCRALDGKKIGIKEFFLLAGEAFKPEGAENVLSVTHSKRHAPYHGGCDCMVVAG